MSDRTERILKGVIERAIIEVRTGEVPVYTFALYHDHESAAVSVCVDTESNSESHVLEQNAWRIERFREKVREGDLNYAALFNANPGRNLSLGDFALVNVARTNLPCVRVAPDFYPTMVRTLMAYEDEIVALASDPLKLMFCCSGPDNEVKYIWSRNHIA